MANEATFSLVLDAGCRLGECPVWDAEDEALWFTDISGMALHRYEPETGAHHSVECDEEVGCFAPTADGRLLAATRSGLWFMDRDGRKLERLAENPEDHAASRFNDGGTDPRGRFWLGTIDERRRGSARLYRYDSRGLSMIEAGLMTSNGVAFSPDGSLMYHADTPRFTIYRYAYDAETGTAGDRQVFARLDKDSDDRARPDGAAVDAEGCYWTALFDGARVRRYAPDGTVLAEYPVAARRPTMPAFGGPDMKTLFVTSARGRGSRAETGGHSQAGGLFAMRVDVPGIARARFDPEI
ncbi:SMP-30/gluconolactonase/LRE family protein [Pararhizobium mangrovi]|uniref:SMP-30/gluconolactonase/LRE family protein n=1 Tax=Pararhizobium mangrovi TaxID=2590452 RepID=A0A506U3E9_9HYPH|nr:SMP-30/gluconolactonase/LRE family protein [Pararhizobium mangrovi]TPW28360.1 SMP-30/gluconolactonase/LRE family protein [Pararhizobium mangrovi]